MEPPLGYEPSAPPVFDGGSDDDRKELVAVDEIVRLVDAAPEPIESRFKLGYGSAALLLATGAPPKVLRKRIEPSFGQHQNLETIQHLEADVRRLEAALAEAEAFAARARRCAAASRAVVRLEAGAIEQIFWSTPPLHVPRDRGNPRHLRHLAEELERPDVRGLVEREWAQRPETALASIECHRCPWGSTIRCDAAWRELERVRERLAQRRAALDAARNAYGQEVLSVVGARAARIIDRGIVLESALI